MLNRRHLRVKVLQTLYSFHQSENKTLKVFEKSLLKSVDEVFEMYISVLSLFTEVADYASIDADERANKHLPEEDDLRANLKLQTNKFILALRKNPEYLENIKKYKISWSYDPEIVKAIFSQLKGSEEYHAYLIEKDTSIQKDKDIIKYIFKKIILKLPVIEQVFEEKFINWPIDKEVLQALIAKTFKNFSSNDPKENKLAELFPNEVEDIEFIVDLLNKAIANDETYHLLIAQKTKNWDAERIAMMDILLMKLAITEFEHFSSILDKILADLKSSDKIHKFGRGLLE
jgi:transcription antitermination protein NusB